MQSLRQISAHLEQTAEALKFSQSFSQHAADSFVISSKMAYFSYFSRLREETLAFGSFQHSQKVVCL